MNLKNLTKKTRVEDHDEVETEGTWAVSYGDMVTLLLTFFILYFSTKPADYNSKKEALKVSLVETLQKHSKLTDGNGSAKENSDVLNISKEKTKEQGMSKDVLKVWNGVAHDLGNHVIVEFPGVSFFRSGEISLTQSGARALADFLKVYMPYAGNYQVSVRAFTDDKKVKNKKFRFYKDNLELSALRSVAGLRELQKLGIPLHKIKLAGYGEINMTAEELAKIPESKRGIASIEDKKFARSLSRRIVLVIEPEEK